ncbi:MAG TPA: hypothetical protein VGE32_11910, partial [Cellvibrio sp.]
ISCSAVRGLWVPLIKGKQQSSKGFWVPQGQGVAVADKSGFGGILRLFSVFCAPIFAGLAV